MYHVYICFFLMIRRPPRSTRTDTLFPYTTLFRSATALMIAANSMHKLAEEVGAAISIPRLHIVDETGEKMRADGVRTAAVIGTRNVMTESWYRQRLVRYGLTLAPFHRARSEAIARAPQRPRLNFRPECAPRMPY